MKKFIIVFFLVVLLSSCGTPMPQTDIGKANLFDASLRAYVDQFNLEVALSTDEDYKPVLEARRLAILNAIIPAKAVSIAAYSGQPLSIAMLDAVNTALLMLKQNYLLKGVVASKEEISIMLQQAHVYPEVGVRGEKSPFVVLIELIQGMLVIWQQVQHQATLDEAGLQAEFEINHQWIVNFTEADLAVVN